MAKYNKIYDENFNVIGVQEAVGTSVPIKVYDWETIGTYTQGGEGVSPYVLLGNDEAEQIIQDLKNHYIIYVYNIGNSSTKYFGFITGSLHHGDGGVVDGASIYLVVSNMIPTENYNTIPCYLIYDM